MLKEIIIEDISALPKEVFIEVISSLIEDKNLHTVEKAEIIYNIIQNKPKQNKLPPNIKKWKFSEKDLINLDKLSL